jgi:hypothetical protein
MSALRSRAPIGIIRQRPFQNGAVGQEPTSVRQFNFCQSDWFFVRDFRSRVTKHVVTVFALMLATSMALLVRTAGSKENVDAKRVTLLDLLGTQENRWVFNHLCIPANVLGQIPYTNGDFVDGYLSLNRSRWAEAWSALERKDDAASAKALAPILHSVIDAYWPGRVVRDESGAITKFHDCEEFGQLKGILREEHGGGSGPSGADKDRVTGYLAQIIKASRGGQPFEDAEAILRSGPLRISTSAVTSELPRDANANNNLAQLAPSSTPPSAALIVSEVEGNFRLSVPISKLVMTIPHGNLSQSTNPVGGAAASPRYFLLSDSTHGINISGWFESSNSYSGFENYWNREKGAWHERGMPEPQHEAKSHIGGWELVAYDMAVPVGGDAHIRAEWVQDGTWIDLHISAGSNEPVEALRETVMNLLRSIKVTLVP